LALTLLTSGGGLVRIVHLQTKGTEFSFILLVHLLHVLIQLAPHQANIHEMHTCTELPFLDSDLFCIQPPINFTMEKEQHKKINYLDITIHCKDKQLEF
jgi:hypothetical protein